MTHFWKINLTTNAITLHSDGLPLGKTSHSMIYIPHKYVFIIGGSSNNNVYYYNEDTKLFEQWAALNSAHAGSACAFINDALLYVFSDGSCERTNLRTQPYWEQVVPRVENEMLRMQQRLFGCCWDAKDEKVLLFGGRNVDNEERKECTGVIAYDWKGNVFVETKVKFMECELREKTFLPFNDKYSYVLPKIKGKNVKLVYYNNIAKEFKEIAFIEDEETLQQQPKAKITLTTTMKHHTNNIKSNINYKRYNFDMPTLNTKFLNTCSGFPKAKVNKTYTNTPFGNTATGDDNTNTNTNANTNNIFDQLKE